MKLEWKMPPKKIGSIIVDVLNEAVIPVAKSNTEDVANEICQEVKDKILDGSFNFENTAPLNSEYAKRKEKEYPGKPILVRSEEYINSIEVQPTTDGKGFTVGVADNIHFGEEGQEPMMARDLAHQLEYGNPSINLPPRPHWRPVYAKYRRRMLYRISPEDKARMYEQANKTFAKYLKQKNTKNARGE